MRLKDKIVVLTGASKGIGTVQGRIPVDNLDQAMQRNG
jgi:NADP-dependent 3-hydroxy acid dehydrogenase YdfG